MRGVGRGRRETEMDGVKSLAAQGHGHGEREKQCTDAQRRSGRGFGKMTSQKVVYGGIIRKEREEGVCVCVGKGRDQGQEGDVEGEKKKRQSFIGENVERRGGGGGDAPREMQK